MIAELMIESNNISHKSADWHASLGYPRLYQRNELKTELDEQNQFYTYIIWRQDGQPLTPFYVGKGRHGRALHHQMHSEFLIRERAIIIPARTNFLVWTREKDAFRYQKYTEIVDIGFLRGKKR